MQTSANTKKMVSGLTRTLSCLSSRRSLFWSWTLNITALGVSPHWAYPVMPLAIWNESQCPNPMCWCHSEPSIASELTKCWPMRRLTNGHSHKWPVDEHRPVIRLLIYPHCLFSGWRPLLPDDDICVSGCWRVIVPPIVVLDTFFKFSRSTRLEFPSFLSSLTERKYFQLKLLLLFSDHCRLLQCPFYSFFFRENSSAADAAFR